LNFRRDRESRMSDLFREGYAAHLSKRHIQRAE
jgi:hypothetical protein